MDFFSFYYQQHMVRFINIQHQLSHCVWQAHLETDLSDWSADRSKVTSKFCVEIETEDHLQTIRKELWDEEETGSAVHLNIHNSIRLKDLAFWHNQLIILAFSKADNLNLCWFQLINKASIFMASAYGSLKKLFLIVLHVGQWDKGISTETL